MRSWSAGQPPALHGRSDQLDAVPLRDRREGSRLAGRRGAGGRRKRRALGRPAGGPDEALKAPARDVQPARAFRRDDPVGVRDAARRERRLADAQIKLLIADADEQFAVEHMEGFVLVVVDMQWWRIAVRRERLEDGDAVRVGALRDVHGHERVEEPELFTREHGGASLDLGDGSTLVFAWGAGVTNSRSRTIVCSRAAV